MKPALFTTVTVPKPLAVLIFFIAAWTGCAGPKPSSDTEAAAASRRASFDSANADFHQGLRANDTALFVYVSEDVVLMPPGEPVIRGKAAMRDWYNGFLAQFHTSSLTFSDREVFVGDQWAIDLGTYEWGLAPVAAGEPVVDRGNYMQVWQAQPDGQWRFHREIWNSAVPVTPPTR